MGRLYTILSVSLAAIWTLFVILFVNILVHKDERLVNEIAHSQARSMIQLMEDLRGWTANHGGVYVPVTEENLPNPYLKLPNRDVQTTGGMKLTLVNPAYMTRQLSQISYLRSGVRTHITSLTPLRPGNVADDWEYEALQSFAAGEPYYSKIIRDPETGYLLHYMKPLFMENSCKGCHSAAANGSFGRVRGGISFIIPVDELVHGRAQILRMSRTLFIVIWIIGLLIISGLMIILQNYSPFVSNSK